MNISGFATSEGTENYRRKMAAHVSGGHFRRAENLWWSSIGIGTYLGSADGLTDRLVFDAIISSINGGINVVDTAINYRRQHAERSVGQALQKLIKEGKYQRNEIVVSTKGGFLPHPDNARWFQKEYANDSKSPIGMQDLVGDCHCMHPNYLADQLERSRNNMGLNTIDLYYIHNPETQLGLVDDETFYNRLGKAFEMLEANVSEGKIRYYGLATWNAFRLSEDKPQHISLIRAKELARVAAGSAEDHFRFIQLPLNLKMPQAFMTATQSIDNETLPIIPTAGKLGIHPIISSSISQGEIGPLAKNLKKELGTEFSSDAQRALQITRSAPGITSALIGMKQPKHVSENLTLSKIPPLSSNQFRKFLDQGL